MAGCKPCSKPVDLQFKLFADSSHAVQDDTHFWSLADTLQYLTFTRPNIAYVVQQVCLHMHDPWVPHMTSFVNFRVLLTMVFYFGVPHLSLRLWCILMQIGKVVLTLDAYFYLAM